MKNASKKPKAKPVNSKSAAAKPAQKTLPSSAAASSPHDPLHNLLRGTHAQKVCGPRTP